MTKTRVDYCDLAKRSVNDPILALLACCPNCGGDIGVHAGFARLLDTMYGTGVKFCEYNGRDCRHAADAREWVWTRYFARKQKNIPLRQIELDADPVFFEVAA